MRAAKEAAEERSSGDEPEDAAADASQTARERAVEDGEAVDFVWHREEPSIRKFLSGNSAWREIQRLLLYCGLSTLRRS